ncbi:MAG TPA: hypothetical protein DHV64_01685 [Erythrobacter sp.]|mgnify:CR=1 FL=1|jgi:hypothetical protein|nr:hypothetical protein [Erythrobacter sp.]|tara:strand:+ start:439 stop:972 length:534 start_codon:yes stop_codon:yes gene_type:complete
MGFWSTAAVLVAVSVALVALVRKNLEQRELARKLRDVFIAEANDLVAKPEFPDEHAKLFINMASIPQGWATRFYVATLAKRLFFGRRERASAAPKFDSVPQSLRKKYVLAMLAFALSDSYRCVVFGHIFRATNSWLGEAVKEPKRDVNAHATRIVIDQVSQASARRQTQTHAELAAA